MVGSIIPLDKGLWTTHHSKFSEVTFQFKSLNFQSFNFRIQASDFAVALSLSTAGITITQKRVQIVSHSTIFHSIV